MKITGIEPTPSPHTMKLTLDEQLPGGKSGNYTHDNKDDAPRQIQQLFDIDGIKGVYHVADFLALERKPKANWEEVLAEARKVFGQQAEKASGPSSAGTDHFGEIQVQVQVYKYIPMQIKLLTGDEEKRVGLPERFTEAAFAAAGEQGNIVFERKWEERSARFGHDLEAIGTEVAEEIAAAYSQERLDQLVQWGDPSQTDPGHRPQPLTVTKEMIQDPDWRNRYASLDQMDPGEEDLPVLDMALDDEKQSVRRLATTLIGMIETKVTLPYLYKALKDRAVTVRRTAGDALSDLGEPEAMEA
ncbi:HEAT repeat-containing protein [Natribacillus halophilus]|uniref:HEAT repeat-containing protein n=1 Tax=Natribacillus halophilus TaxID=549003 RepID=A0A1G8JAM6_9BACI|nr:HEAT repeat-containing protein [Natribacillus halophilus]